jgi:hypothetical protein
MMGRCPFQQGVKSREAMLGVSRACNTTKSLGVDYGTQAMHIGVLNEGRGR